MNNVCRYMLCICFLFFGASSYAGNSIIIASNDYEPYTSSKNGGEGVLLNIIEQAFKEVDLEVSFRFFPWKRCQDEVDKGLAFAATPYFKTIERQAKYDFSDPILPMFNRWFYNKENFPNGFEWSEMDDFQGYRIGGVLGYWYIADLQQLGLNPELVSNDLQNLQMLATHRIDFTIIDELTGNGLVRKYLPSSLDNIGTLEKPYDFQYSHLLVSRNYPNSEAIREKFNEGLRILKENGKYWQILIKHKVPEHFRQDK